jgi:hypothetical protein
MIDAEGQVGETGVTFKESRTIKFVSKVNIDDLWIIEDALIDVKRGSHVWSQVVQITFDFDVNLGI